MALRAAPGSLAGCPPHTTAQAMPIGVQLGKGADPPTRAPGALAGPVLGSAPGETCLDA